MAGEQLLVGRPQPGAQINRAHPLSRGLIGCWLFNENGGIQAWDYSDRHSHGILTNFAVGGLSGCRSSLGLQFDGSDDYVTATINPPLLSADLTLLAWVYKDVATPIASVRPVLTSQVANYGNYWATLNAYYSGGLSDRWNFGLYNGAQNPYINVTDVVLRRWTQLIGERNTGLTRIGLWIDTQLSGTATDTTTSVPAYSALQIGAQTSPSNRYSQERIAVAQVWSRTLSSDEKKWLFVDPYAMFVKGHRISMA